MLYTHKIITPDEPTFLYNMPNIVPTYHTFQEYDKECQTIDHLNSFTKPYRPNDGNLKYPPHIYYVYVYPEHIDVFEFTVTMANGTITSIQK